MNEKYHFGFELLFQQRVYNFDIVKDKEQNDLIAVRKEPLLRKYDFFGEKGIADKTAGILSDIVRMYEKKKESNQRRLFEKFIQNWGFLDPSSEKLSMNEFWNDISKVAALLKRYSQVINGELEELKKWMDVRELGHVRELEHTKLLKGKYTSLNDLPSMEEGHTHEIKDIGTGHILLVKIKPGEFERNALPCYQFWGFDFINRVIEEKIDWKLSLHKYNLKQENSYLPIEEITVTPTWIPSDLLTCIYTLLFILATKKQKVCVACYCPFNPPRPNAKHCSETCKELLKKRRLRKKGGSK